MKHLEAARQSKFIGSGLEAQVEIGPGHPHHKLLARYDGPLAPLFIVSQVKLVDGDAPPVAIRRADGTKCERCWKYTTDVGSDPELADRLQALRRCGDPDAQWLNYLAGASRWPSRSRSSCSIA